MQGKAIERPQRSALHARSPSEPPQLRGLPPLSHCGRGIGGEGQLTRRFLYQSRLGTTHNLAPRQQRITQRRAELIYFFLQHSREL